jgi:anti-sigma factor RsiW
MTCEQIDELLSDLLDGELADATQRAVEFHLQSCDACTASYKRLKRTVRFVRANSDPALAPGTPGGLYAQFTRSHMDPTMEKSTSDIIRDGGGLT